MDKGPEYHYIVQYYTSTILPRKQWVKDQNIHSFKEDKQMANRHMKKSPTSLITRKMQVKTMVRYLLTSVTMTVIKKVRNNVLAKMEEKRGSQYIVDKNVNWCRDWKTVQKFLKILRVELSYNLAVPLLDVYPKTMKMLIQRFMQSMFIGALFETAKTQKQSKCLSIEKWTRKCGIHTLLLLFSC